MQRERKKRVNLLSPEEIGGNIHGMFLGIVWWWRSWFGFGFGFGFGFLGVVFVFLVLGSWCVCLMVLVWVCVLNDGDELVMVNVRKLRREKVVGFLI